jgi:hypothetical protein
MTSRVSGNRARLPDAPRARQPHRRDLSSTKLLGLLIPRESLRWLCDDDPTRTDSSSDGFESRISPNFRAAMSNWTVCRNWQSYEALFDADTGDQKRKFLGHSVPDSRYIETNAQGEWSQWKWWARTNRSRQNCGKNPGYLGLRAAVAVAWRIVRLHRCLHGRSGR